MKQKLLICSLLLLCYYSKAQLPPVAQELYDEAVAQDSAMVQYAINNGAEILPTPDGNSFYIKWFPSGATPSATPLVVSLHGSNGFAFHEFFSWHQRLQLKGCGIVALQWYRGDSSATPGTYFGDDAIYQYIDSALSAISYPSGKAMLHGFSRGSSRSYAITVKDILAKNYFCTILSNSGGMDSSYPFNAQINANAFGTSVFTGKRWNLFCGGQDPNPDESGCPAMAETKTWLESRGASVDIFIQDAALNHNGFQLQSSAAYKDTILDDYLKCFNGATDAGTVSHQTLISVYPNPFTNFFTIGGNGITDSGQISVYNSLGELVLMGSFSHLPATFEADRLAPGFYSIVLNSGTGRLLGKFFKLNH